MREALEGVSARGISDGCRGPDKVWDLRAFAEMWRIEAWRLADHCRNGEGSEWSASS